MKIIRPYITITLILSLILFSCKKDEDRIPYRYVDFYIYLSDPEYTELNSVYAPVMVSNVGVLGIIIYRKTDTEFMALERMCPYKPSDNCSVVIDSTGYFASCPCCGSKFSLPSDGSLENGPAERPLVQYTTAFDGQKIHITN